MLNWAGEGDCATNREGDWRPGSFVELPELEPDEAVRTKLNFEGDLDIDRRNDRTAALTSTWWTCVGEGRVNVPPPLLEYDIPRADAGHGNSPEKAPGS